MKHYSVLKKEAIEALNIKEDGIYVDATLGYAGDASEILKRIKRGKLFAFDKDLEAINYSKEILQKIGSSYEIIHRDFVYMKEELAKRNIQKVDGILFDLGVSSPQLDEDRGFSFMRCEKLDMRMDQSSQFSACELIANYSYEQLKNIFFAYGEEKQSALIAKKIVEKRSKQKILTTFDLLDCIKEAVGSNYFYKKHPERNIFQAIRIEVNKELDHLAQILPIAVDLLNKNGRLVVITFHSLEDRITKKVFHDLSEVDPLVKGLPQIPQEYQPKLKLINRKVILPSEEELQENSRSASAKMRVVERM